MIDYTEIDKDYFVDKIAGRLQIVSIQPINGSNTHIWAPGDYGFNPREENLAEYRYRKLREQE